MICTEGYTGVKDFEACIQPRLIKHGIVHEVRQINSGDIWRDGYRVFDADPHEFVSDAEVLVFFDGIIESGKTIAGFYIWAIENSSVLGIKQILSLVIKDNNGYANYSFLPFFLRNNDFIGPTGSISHASPDKYNELKDLLGILSNDHPYDHEKFKRLGSYLRDVKEWDEAEKEWHKGGEVTLRYKDGTVMTGLFISPRSFDIHECIEGY